MNTPDERSSIRSGRALRVAVGVAVASLLVAVGALVFAATQSERHTREASATSTVTSTTVLTTTTTIVTTTVPTTQPPTTTIRVVLTDPYTLGSALDAVARSIMGRSTSADDHAAFVAEYNASERAFQIHQSQYAPADPYTAAEKYLHDHYDSEIRVYAAGCALGGALNGATNNTYFPSSCNDSGSFPRE